jgi:hypothetical protein
MASETYSETFTSSSSTTGQTATVFTADAGGGFAVDAVQVHIRSGASTDVEVQVFAGDEPIAPKRSPLDLAGETVQMPVDVHISPANSLVARHDNGSASDHVVTVLITGEPV